MDGVVRVAVGIDGRLGGEGLPPRGEGVGRLARRRARVDDRVRLAAERIVEMLRDAVLSVRGDAGEPHVLHRIVEMVGAGHR